MLLLVVLVPETLSYKDNFRMIGLVYVYQKLTSLKDFQRDFAFAYNFELKSQDMTL